MKEKDRIEQTARQTQTEKRPKKKNYVTDRFVAKDVTKDVTLLLPGTEEGKGRREGRRRVCVGGCIMCGS